MWPARPGVSSEGSLPSGFCRYVVMLTDDEIGTCTSKIVEEAIARRLAFDHSTSHNKQPRNRIRDSSRLQVAYMDMVFTVPEPLTINWATKTVMPR